MKSGKRIAYIDALRGFTMFLVVYWHVMALSFGINAEESVVGNFFLTFRMPMFFFISGYLGYKALEYFNGSKFAKLARKKSFVQLVPTTIFFSLYQISIGSSPLVFFTDGLTGYWFTLVLFELFITYYSLSYIINTMGGGNNKRLITILVLISVLGNAAALWINTRNPMPRVSLVLTLNNFFYYFQFFTFGIIVKAFPKFKQKIKDHYSVAVILFVALFIVQYKWFTHDYNRYLFYLVDSILIKYAGLVTVFGLFSLSEEYFAKNGRISSIMQYAGSRTLDIYLLHYFFLPVLPNYRYLFFPNGKESYISELVIISLISIIIMAICLLISTCLRKSSVLAKYLFGILPKKVVTSYYENSTYNHADGRGREPVPQCGMDHSQAVD